MGDTNITRNVFRHGSMRYFRGDAEDVVLGSYGEKKNPIGAKAFLAVEGRVKRDFLEDRIDYVTTADIDWSRESKADVEATAGLKVFGSGKKAAASFDFEKAKTANLKLAKFRIMERPLKQMLNEDANAARNYLAREGHDGRIVSEVWVLMEGQLASSFATAAGGKISASVAGNDLEVSANVGASGSETITLSPGTTFAYAMHKVKSWNHGKKRIEDMEGDFHGLG